MDPAEAPICHNSATGLARRLSKVLSSYESSPQHILHIVPNEIYNGFYRNTLAELVRYSVLPFGVTLPCGVILPFGDLLLRRLPSHSDTNEESGLRLGA